MRKRPQVRIGVIADTHGLYDPAVEAYFSRVAAIVHAGDIGGRSVIERLHAIAPVIAVSGNIDDYERSGFPRQVLFIRNGIRIAVRHHLYERGRLAKDAQAWLDREQPDICIFGHSHQPTVARYRTTLLFNPGSAGPKRFSLPRAIGMLTLRHGTIDHAHMLLDNRPHGNIGKRGDARSRASRSTV